MPTNKPHAVLQLWQANSLCFLYNLKLYNLYLDQLSVYRLIQHNLPHNNDESHDPPKADDEFPVICLVGDLVLSQTYLTLIEYTVSPSPVISEVDVVFQVHNLSKLPTLTCQDVQKLPPTL